MTQHLTNDFYPKQSLQSQWKHQLTYSTKIQIVEPITLPYQDSNKRIIQIWKSQKYGLLGSVVGTNGSLTIIPGHKILNPLNNGDSPETLLQRLNNSLTKTWNFAFDSKAMIITVWPHLIAAGKGKEVRPIRFEGSPLRYTSEKDLLSMLKRNGYTDKPGDPNAFTNEKKGIQVHIDRRGEGNDPNQPDHIDVRFSSEKLNEIERKNQLFNIRLREEKKAEIEKQVKERKISAKEGNKFLHEFNKRLDKNIQKHDLWRAKWRFAFGEKPPAKTPTGNNDPAEKNFTQRTQQTNLTESYNSTHRQNPMPAKEMTQRDIGGVSCSIDYIEGLFDSPTSLFESDHYFCMPKLAEEQLPFTNDQLHQILRELSIGIYAHSTVPFFSLHFRQDTADLFPVIHPAYEHTLIGRVISMLDYIMKGYLNGGVFTEEFIDEWHKNPLWHDQKRSALDNLIDFESYCKKHLEGEDQSYASTKSMIHKMKESGLFAQLAEMCTDESPILSNFEGFKNSFRIIAKQNSYQKHQSLFMIDSDFDVEYTISPSPEYQEALTHYIRKHGTAPLSHQRLVTAYEVMKKRIHDHMVKMPLCRQYFSMLGVITFFSSYLSTLKKHRRIPILPVFHKAVKTGCPPLFPNLPITTIAKESLRINAYKSILDFATKHKNELDNFVSELMLHLLNQTDAKNFDAVKVKKIQDLMLDELISNTLDLCSFDFKRSIKKDKRESEISELMNKPAKSFMDILLDCIERVYDVHKDALQNESMRLYNIEIIKSIISTKFPTLFEGGVKELTSPITYNVQLLNSEIPNAGVETNKRVVGGCGLILTEQKLKPSTKAESVLRDHYKNLISLESETWQEVNLEGSKGFVFKLGLEKTPAWINDDFQWMESLIQDSKSNVESIERRVSIQKAMFSGNVAEFRELVDKTSDLHKLKGKNGSSLLHTAALLEDPSYTECLLNKGLDPLVSDDNGYLPVHYGAMKGRLKPLELLLNKCPSSLNHSSIHGLSPLTTAIQHGQEAVVDFLLARKPTPALLTSGYTDLHCALHEGNERIIKAVLAYKPITSYSINVCSEEGGTPLMLACELDSPELVCILLEKGAKASISKNGLTAIEIAAYRRCIPVLKVLLVKTVPSCSAFLVTVKTGTPKIVELLLASSQDFLNYKNDSGDNLLHIALNSGNIPVALHLTKFPPLCNGQNIERRTPFNLALLIGAWEVVSALYKNGAEVDFKALLETPYNPLVKTIFADFTFTQSELQEYLLIALQARNFLTVTQVLIPEGAKLGDVEGPKGWKAPHYLAKCDAIFAFRTELSKGLDFLMPLPQDGNRTLPYIAAEHGSTRVLFLLLEQMKKRNIELTQHFQDKHLLYPVIRSGNLNNFKKMLDLFENLVDVHLDNQGTRPVHLAAQLGLREMLKLLAEKGANLNARDQNNRTPLFYAKRANDQESVDFLIEKRVLIDEEQTDDVTHDKELPAHKYIEKNISPKELPLAQLVERNYLQQTPLHLAAQLSSSKILDDLLTVLPKSEHHPIDKMGRTPIFYAIESKNWQNVRLLIYAKSDVNFADYRLITPLTLAIGQDLSIVKMLVDAGADINQIATTQRMTPLVCSMIQKRSEITRYLLYQGARHDISTSDGIYPIHVAAENGDDEFIRLLTARGASLKQRDSKGLQPKHKAAIQGKTKTLETLLEGSGDSVNTPLCLPSNAENNGLENATLLHFAALSSNPDTADWLLRHKADSEAKTENGQDALSFAGQSSAAHSMFEVFSPYRILQNPDSIIPALVQTIHQDHLEGTIALYKKGIPINAFLSNSYTGLQMACLMGAPNCTSWFLQCGADPYFKGSGKQNAFELSAANNSSEQFELLIESTDIDLDLTYQNDRTLLHIATKANRLKNALVLITNDCEVNVRDESGFTPLHFAVKNKNLDLIRVLLACGAIPDFQTINDATPLDLVDDNDKEIKSIFNEYQILWENLEEGESKLHLAVKSGHLLSIMTLAQIENVNQINANGKTALDLAKSFNNTDAIIFLSNI